MLRLMDELEAVEPETCATVPMGGFRTLNICFEAAAPDE